MDEDAIVIDIVTEVFEEEPPKLFDLTGLQKEANSRYGLSAAETLNCAQSLYEDGILSYPRTSSHYITSDMVHTISSLLSDTGDKSIDEVGANIPATEGESYTKTVEIKGGTYEKLESVLKNNNLSEREYIKLSRTPQHQLSKQNKELVYKIRMELTADVTNSAGVVKPGTRISKSIDASSFKKFYREGDRATLGGCIALKRDTDMLYSDLELIDSTGLRFEGSNFVNGEGKPNVFYLVEGELMSGQPDLVVRVSATTEAVGLSKEVLKQFNSKYPDYLYNGYRIDDISSANNTYLNEIWSRNSEKQVDELSNITGISPDNIVTEEARYYNRVTNPDTGTGITLNQGNSSAMGIPEFFAKHGRVGIKNGNIYKIEGNNKTPVANIGRTGKIKYV